MPTGSWATTTAASVTRSIMVTPEQHRLEDLLVEMRTQRQHISLVVDEHGTVVGLVTMEDLIEELIGDFDDESDLGRGECERIGDRTYRMTGTLRPDQFEERVGVALPDGDWQTVAGYVIAEVDEIPDVGDVIETEIGAFEVLARDGYAIDSLSVRLHDSP